MSSDTAPDSAKGRKPPRPITARDARQKIAALRSLATELVERLDALSARLDVPLQRTFICEQCQREIEADYEAGVPKRWLRVGPSAEGSGPQTGEARIRLRRQGAVVLDVLLRHPGRTVTYDHLIFSLFEADRSVRRRVAEPADPKNQLAVIVADLRRALRGTPVRILTEWGVGYRLPQGGIDLQLVT